MRDIVSPEIRGVPIKRFIEPTREQLKLYSEQTDGRVQFDLVRAARLESTPHKPNSARSETNVIFENDEAGTLFTIAFAPGDSTGSDVTFPIGTFPKRQGGPPIDPKYYPRSKQGIFAELQFPLVTARIDQYDKTIEPGGELGVLTVQGTGEPGSRLEIIQSGKLPYRGVQKIADGIGGVNLTTGYNEDGERFGDPHAIYHSDRTRSVIVCSFLAIMDTDAQRLQPMMQALNAQPYVQIV